MKKSFDPTTLEIYRALYTSVAEEMGLTLRRTAHSPNIKERRDYSCAVFDAAGRVIAQGDHMPVHLGSMPMAVAAALRETNIGPGDVIVLNDPFAGGTHLPDVTLVSGVFGGVLGVGDWVLGKRRRPRRATNSSKTTPPRHPAPSTQHPAPSTRHPHRPAMSHLRTTSLTRFVTLSLTLLKYSSAFFWSNFG